MKVFIVQSQKDKTESDLKIDQETVRMALNDFYSGETYEILDIPFRGKEEQLLEFLGRSLAVMAQADCVVYMDGCEGDKLCLCLNFCAAIFGKECRFI